MEKSGGDSSYLNNFVDNVLGNTQAGGTKKRRAKKNGGFADLGVVELSPFLVSLVNLGAHTAIDPKLNKSKKKMGGNDEIALDMPLVGGKLRKGRKAKSPSRRSKSPSRRSKSPSRRSKSPSRRSKSPSRPIRRGRRVKRGGAEFSQFGMNDMPNIPTPVYDSPVLNVQNAINATASMTGGKKRKGVKKSGGDASNFMENFNKMPTFKDMVVPQDVSTVVTGGAKKRKTKGGQDNNCSETKEAFTLFGGKSKKRTIRGGNADNLINMRATEALEPFSLFGGKKPRGRKANKGGDVQLTEEELAKQNPQLAMRQYIVPTGMSQPMSQPMPQPMSQPMSQHMLQPMPQDMLQPMPQPVYQPIQQPGTTMPVSTTGGKRLRKKKGGSYEIPPPLPDMPSPPMLTGGKKSSKKRGGNANEAQDLMLLPQ
jgi:hypothetical protein